MTGLAHLDVGSALSYLIAVLIPALDALIPVLPSETVVIALGVATAGSADPRIAVLVALAAFGAFLGDNAAYLLGHRFGPVIGNRVFAGERGARRKDWARRSLNRFGGRLIIVCRFIPGGRTAVTLTCGLIGYPRRSFVLATGAAGVLWASYAFFLGRLGGKAFEGQPWLGLLLAFGVALAVTGLIEVGRRVSHWHSRTRQAADGQDPDPGQQGDNAPRDVATVPVGDAGSAPRMLAGLRAGQPEGSRCR